MRTKKLMPSIRKSIVTALAALLGTSPWAVQNAFAQVAANVTAGAQANGVPAVPMTMYMGGPAQAPGGIALPMMDIGLDAGSLSRQTALPAMKAAGKLSVPLRITPGTRRQIPVAADSGAIQIQSSDVEIPDITSANSTLKRADTANPGMANGRRTVLANISGKVVNALKVVRDLPNTLGISAGEAHGIGVKTEDLMTGAESFSLDRSVSAPGGKTLSGFTARRRTLTTTLQSVSGAFGVPRLVPALAANQAKNSRVEQLGAVSGTAGKRFRDLLSRAFETAKAFLSSPSSLPALGLAANSGRNSTGRNEAQDSNAQIYRQGADPQLQEKIGETGKVISKIKAEIAKRIIGQKDMVKSIIIAMIAGEHILLEGIPGVAKTATVRAFADALGVDFQRIQGTPDKMPADIIGAEILQEDPQTGKREIKLEKGPIFARVVLVDEINRMMPKTQAALLEGMQERRVTIGREALDLPSPFLLLATQNPIEQEGTYPLPEAQQDRFMFKVTVPQSPRDERMQINDMNRRKEQPRASRVATLDELMAATGLAEQVYMEESLREYIQDIIDAVLDPSQVGIGEKGLVEQAMIIRASIYLEKAARINALMAGHSWVTPEDIRTVAPKILRHRIILSYNAGETTTDKLIQEILNTVPVPKPKKSGVR